MAPRTSTRRRVLLAFFLFGAVTGLDDAARVKPSSNAASAQVGVGRLPGGLRDREIFVGESAEDSGSKRGPRSLFASWFSGDSAGGQEELQGGSIDRHLQTSGSTCSGGIAGVESSDSEVCCDAECSQCGGRGCKDFGPEGSTCCKSTIRNTGVSCSDAGKAPCIIDSNTPAPASTSDSTCTNGLAGVASDNGVFCCDADCSQCGGKGCSRAGGESSTCCAGAISKSEVLCSVSQAAPCIVDDDSMCSNGIPGVEDDDSEYCCSPSCSACGGPGCGKFGTDDAVCCVSRIARAEIMCADSGEAPCIMDKATPAPSGTTVYVPTPDYPFPVPAPTPIMTIPITCTDSLPTIRWASGTGNNGRMYMEGPGCGTMTDLYQTRTEKDGWTAKGPIYMLDDDYNVLTTPTNVTGKWLLTSELFVEGGAVFYCRGSEVGGDCDELRIQSTGFDDWHEVRGHGGSLYFEHTIVTSWDTPNKKPQETHAGGRSFLNCVSEHEAAQNCTGMAKNEMGECRMDIIDSEMGYMGYFDSESYGLTWKVRGFCKDKSNPEVFDTTNVYGDIIRSDIHHMYYGMYSYGHQGGIWTDNLMHDNHQYGFDPHDDSDYLTIARNTVYNNVNHGIIASKRCNNVKIYDNTVFNGGAQAAGIFLHRSSDSCEVYGNHVYDMQDAGMALLESFDADIHDNRFENVKYGVRISLGGGNNHVHDNVFDTCSAYGLYTYVGTDIPEYTEDGRPGENKFTDNEILNTAIGCKIKGGDNTLIEGNVFTGTEKLFFTYARATTWIDNETPGCVRNQVTDNGTAIPASTFTSSTTGLPDNC